MAIPGTPGIAYTADGLSHTERGIPSSGARDHAAQLAKRERKLLGHEYGEYWADIEGDGDTAVVTFGSSTGPVREALARASADGVQHAPRVDAAAGAGAAGQARRGAGGCQAGAGRRTELWRPVPQVSAFGVSDAGRGQELPPSGAAAHPCRRSAPSTRSMEPHMTTATPPQDQRAAHRARFQVGLQPDLVPGLRRLLGTVLLYQGVREPGSAAREYRGRLRHRLFLAYSRLPHQLRLSRRARALARRRRRAQAGASRSHRGGRKRRRRRLLDRRQPFHARLPPQRGHDLRGDGQPRVRHDQGPTLADHRARLGLEAVAGRHRAAHVSSAGDRARGRGEFRGARVLGRPQGHRRHDRRGDQDTGVSRSSKFSRLA